MGKDYVTICPLGTGTIDLNANLIVTDRLALLCGNTFGYFESDRLTFYPEEPREIRIAAGGELDLSSFGQGPSLQQIAFGGHARWSLKQVQPSASQIQIPNMAEWFCTLTINHN